jgi:2-polyprenyl-3-methyl-5-hydroxy-6-metoxy-1,4-benzoquinol methylase
MNDRIHYLDCPVCHSTDIKNVLSVKDYTVSGEIFPIAECGQCSLRFTQDVPGAAAISPYYKSEDYISHTNTSKGLVNRIYKIVRKNTMRRKRKWIEKYTGLEKGKLLDLGSGVGTFAHEMKQYGWEVTGLEPDEDARKAAERLYGLKLADTAEFYQLPGGYFDAITLWHVLEHVHDLGDYIQQLRKLLNEKGKLFIAVPNYTSLDARVYQEYWAAYDVPRHLYHFSPASIKWLIEKNGMKLAQYKPMWYDSFYISILSSKYKNKRTRWIAACWNGFLSNLGAMIDVKKCSSVLYIIEKTG